MVEIDSAKVLLPSTGQGQELPVTITEIRPVDLYEFHSDEDSSDEARPGIFKRDRSKMARAAPLPPAPKELLLKNRDIDVLDFQIEMKAAETLAKAKKKKPKAPKTPKKESQPLSNCDKLSPNK